jgi:hypothetical protein
LKDKEIQPVMTTAPVQPFDFLRKIEFVTYMKRKMVIPDLYARRRQFKADHAKNSKPATDPEAAVAVALTRLFFLSWPMAA